MKLVSRFKDYYDYVFHKYGYDPRKRWVREQTKLNHNLHELRYLKVLEGYEPAFYLVGSKSFFYMRKYTISNIGMRTYTGYLTLREYFQTNNIHKDVESYENEFKDILLKVAIKSKSPIVFFGYESDYSNGYSYKELDWFSNVKLSDSPVASLMTPEECYTEICETWEKYNCVENIPAPLTDASRIEAAGFDLKQSFRHRK